MCLIDNSRSNVIIGTLQVQCILDYLKLDYLDGTIDCSISVG